MGSKLPRVDCPGCHRQVTARPVANVAGKGTVNRHTRLRDDPAPCRWVGQIVALPSPAEAARMAAWARMTEAQWQELVLGRWYKGGWVGGMVAAYGWRAWHETDSRKSPKGLPDALLWRPGPAASAPLFDVRRVLERHGVDPTPGLLAELGAVCGVRDWLAVEFKTEAGALTVDQWQTLADWRACGVEVHIWRPRDVEDVQARMRPPSARSNREL